MDTILLVHIKNQHTINFDPYINISDVHYKITLSSVTPNYFII